MNAEFIFENLLICADILSELKLKKEKLNGKFAKEYVDFEIAEQEQEIEDLLRKLKKALI